MTTCSTFNEYRISFVGRLPSGRIVRHGFAECWERTRERAVAFANELLAERYDRRIAWSVLSIEHLR